ncbi:NADH:flavin oxidoreductase/NADH oxidase [Brevibacillus panacihumi]|uniref:NADH:flavin oxidoreductase/NADH oxidase n=1 Tax=Brevibacillus panacihumi TaxID=497735 RepID=UPI003D241AFA
MALLASAFSYKGLTLKNRVVMPPMCQYSVDAQDGTPNDWHFVHYVSRAVGGAGLIIMEMTDVEPDGRISNRDLGLWSDEQIPAYARIVNEVHKYGAKIGIQIAHAGRKAEDAEVPVSSSPIRFQGDVYKTPRALTTEEVQQMVVKFAESARRAVEAGVDTIEIHGAHGYLIHQFQSPLTNKRDDQYGQDLAFFGVEVVSAIKKVIPADMPLIMRISAVEYVDGGYGLEHSIELCRRYKEAGVDIFHVSSGGEGPIGSRGRPGIHPGYQVPFARAIRQTLEVPVIAVGKLDDAHVAEATLGNGDADLIAVGRGMLHDPYWAIHAIRELSGEVEIPQQYGPGFPKR